MSTNQKRRRRNILHGVIVLLLVCSAIIAFKAYAHYLETAQLISVYFTNSDGTKSERFKLEVARTPAEQSKGLMYRKTLNPDTGMIFVYPDESDKSFWMKNTYVSLDMVFIDNQYNVVGVLSDVPILNEEPRSIKKPSRFVVELAAGSARRNKIVAGSLAVFSRPPALP